VAIPSRISFILKIRVEQPDEKANGAYPDWRGQITHIPSGEQRYVKSLNEVTEFIQAHLATLGVPPAESRPADTLSWWKCLAALFRRPHRQGDGQ
jgi:hypothetical protein